LANGSFFRQGPFGVIGLIEGRAPFKKYLTEVCFYQVTCHRIGRFRCHPATAARSNSGGYEMTKSVFRVGILLLVLWSGLGWAEEGQEGGYLGLQLSTVTSASFNVQTGESESFSGPKVERVIPDSPAAAAGFKVDDRILSVNGRQVEDANQLREILRAMPAGSAVRVRVRRNDAPDAELNVVLGKRPQG
jgi:S1-C subfamily serine protease